MLNRKQAPTFQPITSYQLPKAQKNKLSNSAILSYMQSDAQPVIGLQLVFEAGKCQEKKIGLASITAKMMMEGTTSLTTKQITDKVAFYGASLNIDAGNDFTTIALYTLSKHLKELLPLVLDILQHPIFPQSELDNMINRAVQNLKVQQERTAYQATVKFKNEIFGNAHPYAFSPTEDYFRDLTRADVQGFYDSCIKGQPFQAYLVGDTNQEMVDWVSDCLGQLTIEEEKKKKKSLLKNPASKKVVIYEEQEINVQTSIRMGRLLFGYHHPDYIPFKVLNTILGGYFGSRLMQNIREDKGYTYGIFSRMIAMRNGAYFVIGTDVKKEVYKSAVNEIYKEMERLQTKKVDEKELENVKNYISGNFYNSMSNIFAIIDKVQDIDLYELHEYYYDTYIDRIRAVSAEQIQEMANKYLKNLTEVSIG